MLHPTIAKPHDCNVAALEGSRCGFNYLLSFMQAPSYRRDASAGAATPRYALYGMSATGWKARGQKKEGDVM